MSRARVGLFGGARDGGELPYCDRCNKYAQIRYTVRVGELRLEVCPPCAKAIDAEKSARADIGTTKEAA